MHITSCTINSIKASDIVVNSLGSAICKARLEKGLTVRQLSESADVTMEMVNLLENDTNVPGIRCLLRIESILKVDIGKYDKRYRFSINAATNLRVTRTNLKMTRREFADYISCGKSNLDNWEYTDSPISKKHFNNLIEKLGDNLYIE